MSLLGALTARVPAAALLAKDDGYQAPGLEIFKTRTWFDFTVLGVHFTINRLVAYMFIGALLVGLFYLAAFRRPQLVPGKLQNSGEIVYDFIRNQLAVDVIGPEGRRYAPYLTTLFSFVLILNVYEIVPFFQIPVNSHIAYPAFLAAITWVLFLAVGFRKHGVLGYFKGMMFPPGVPKAIWILLAPIEFMSTIIVRPFTLAVRLFANMFAGHTLLVVFASATAYLLTRPNFSIVFFPVSGLVYVIMTFFELLVIVLQAYIFTILTAQYVASSLAEEH